MDDEFTWRILTVELIFSGSSTEEYFSAHALLKCMCCKKGHGDIEVEYLSGLCGGFCS